ncbi:unnamed protein product [Cladocopium goreaui]|uniref:Uncharacterized protein n=1 Tax=Cladocopium goreaui TaxID=2562237 RepID=A0A9P1BJY4_9DINO|nr:unnamed protein product [Cladocopium goreaui]
MKRIDNDTWWRTGNVENETGAGPGVGDRRNEWNQFIDSARLQSILPPEAILGPRKDEPKDETKDEPKKETVENNENNQGSFEQIGGFIATAPTWAEICEPHECLAWAVVYEENPDYQSALQQFPPPLGLEQQLRPVGEIRGVLTLATGTAAMDAAGDGSADPFAPACIPRFAGERNAQKGSTPEKDTDTAKIKPHCTDPPKDEPKDEPKGKPKDEPKGEPDEPKDEPKKETIENNEGNENNENIESGALF